MRISLLILLLFLSFIVFPQTNVESGERDVFRIYLTKNTSKETVNVTLRADNNRLSTLEAGYDGQMADGSNRFHFSSLSSDNYKLIGDRRSYIKGKYYVDFPLYMELDPSESYTFSAALAGTSIVNNAATIFRLMDTENESFINLLENSYTFTTPQGNKVIYNGNRFVVRIYAACIFKKDNPENTVWTNSNNWIGGLVPGLGTGTVGEIARINNCAIIPEGVTVTLPASVKLTIGSLLSAGDLTIEENAELTVTNETKVLIVSE
ncbi:MAG: hypothetical protein LBQ84_00995 [Flavobacteriaceae bacterium]|jgi:hypothetical protein|nr:hypothetical protein [Flavobacteriaceae bacterium]